MKYGDDMIKIVNCDLMLATEDVIAHQVNCRGKMGSGVARQVREMFPEAYRDYKEIVNRAEHLTYELCSAKRIFRNDVRSPLLGHCQIVPVERQGRTILIANLFAQERYGYDGERYTDYEAFEHCIDTLRIQCEAAHVTRIAMPYKIGCCRGGGDWNKVYDIIDKGLSGFDVVLYRYQG